MIYLGFGSNLGDRISNIHKAYEYLSYFGEIVERSPVYESRAMLYPGDKEEQGDYLNSVVSFETDLSPHALLHEIKSVEAKIGIRNKKKWSARYLDIDILLYHDVILSCDNLILPHPEITKRAFVLKPLSDIAADIIIPGQEKSVRLFLINSDTASLSVYSAG